MDGAEQSYRACRLSVSFGGLQALSDVDLTLHRGEILGLIGPNGAGKTTLINALTGFQRARGRIFLDGQEVTRLVPHRLAAAGIGRTFQMVRLFGGLTVRDNLRAAGRLSWQAAGDLLSLYGLAQYADRPASELAYGDERRLGVARAVAAEPRYLFLDEPAAGLNREEVRDLARLIADTRDRLGCGILIVEHNMSLVMGLCERIQVLDQGRTIALGQPREIAADAGVRAAYLGTRQAGHAAA
ncbi:MAG: ABC transporter ATP-binding protein [Azospirillaceae bacterium]